MSVMYGFNFAEFVVVLCKTLYDCIISTEQGCSQDFLNGSFNSNIGLTKAGIWGHRSQPLREFQHSTLLYFMQKSRETIYCYGEAQVCSTWQHQNAQRLSQMSVSDNCSMGNHESTDTVYTYRNSKVMFKYWYRQSLYTQSMHTLYKNKPKIQ